MTTATAGYPVRLTPSVPVYRGDALRFSVSMDDGGDPAEPVDLLLFGTTFTLCGSSRTVPETAASTTT